MPKARQMRTKRSAHHLQNVMRNCVVGCIALAILVGCGPEQPGAAPVTDGRQTSAPGGNAPGNPAPGNNAPGNLPANAPPAKYDLKIPEQTLAVAPTGQEGWRAQPESKAVQVGRQVDTALRDLKGAWADTRIVMEGPDGELVGNGFMKVADRKKFHIRYSLPRTRGSLNILLGDGTQRALKEEEGFRKLPAFADPTTATVTGADLPTILSEVPALPNRIFERDQNVFESLLKHLQDDPSFKVVVEETTTRVADEERPLVRIVAERTGDNPATFEIVVDGKRNLPLTLRSISRIDGGTLKVMWTGQWRFGGTFAENEFRVPGA
jgi:hypothetical protein